METAVQNNLIASTAERLVAAGGVVAASAGAVVLYFVNPSNTSFLPPCPFLTMTGLACPGCGLTRGFHALFHGDFVTALDFNALIPLFVVIFGLLFATMFLVAVRGRSFPMWTLKPGVLIAFLVLLLSFAVVRNLPYYPFNILYP